MSVSNWSKHWRRLDLYKNSTLCRVSFIRRSAAERDFDFVNLRRPTARPKNRVGPTLCYLALRPFFALIASLVNAQKANTQKNEERNPL